MRPGWRHVFDNDAELIALHAREAFEAGASPLTYLYYDPNSTEGQINTTFGEVVRSPKFIEISMLGYWGPVMKVEKPGEKPQLDASGNMKVVLLKELCTSALRRPPSIRDHIQLNGREYTTISVGEGRLHDQRLLTYELEVAPYGK